MDSMSVKPAMVVELSGQIRSGASGIRSELEQLDAEVSKLRESWSGAAQQAYDRAHREWTQSLTQMNELLGRIATTTEEISQNYVSSDNASAGRFQL